MLCNWEQLYKEIPNCKNCPLADSRHNAVIGMGNPNADVMFIGEGPGHDEDMTGLPFVGKAGQLLDKMLAAINIHRDKVYIANIVKCRPPQNRTPQESEALQCLPYLRQQVALIKPKIIVCLGATAVRYVIGNNVRITKDRGVWYEKKGVYILPTYHPAALLYDESKKRESWEDLKKLRAMIEELGIVL